MATQKNGMSNGWMITGIAITGLLGLGSILGQFINPKGDIAAVETREDAKFNELKSSLADLQKDIRWNYASKDLLLGKVAEIVEENKTYRTGIERIIGRIETKGNALDTEIHGTYSPKDALASINNRIIELERAVRDSAKQPLPVTQK